ncbi:alpha/beta fold hydrolase [Longispora albida]|uniref:alpha/beta fold hydrolase n=1 Tax=Longispora albida TaxID=203523 RepID=UPI0003623AA9|nr:alpha/beta hydrolase [Longispora albida]
MNRAIHHTTTPTLHIGYEHTGDPTGTPVILLHGFPYDTRAYDHAAPAIAAHGASVHTPYLRGFGPTTFRDPATPRSGQQAALAQDLTDYMDTLGIPAAILAGYDWGGRAACITAALHPERVLGLVTVDGYNIQDLTHATEPAPPAIEATYWYQYYFHTERGRRGLTTHREELCEHLWRTWSPTWKGATAAFPATAPSLHNPDFTDVVIHSYRHRHLLADGDPQYQALEDLIATQPPITVPTVVIEAGSDGVGGPIPSDDRDNFTGPYRHLRIPSAGHNVPQEAPQEFAAAVTSLLP